MLQAQSAYLTVVDTAAFQDVQMTGSLTKAAFAATAPRSALY